MTIHIVYVPVGWYDYAGREKARGRNFISEEQLFFLGRKDYSFLGNMVLLSFLLHGITLSAYRTFRKKLVQREKKYLFPLLEVAVTPT